MDADMTAQQVTEMFDPATSVSDIRAAYDYAKKQRAPSPV
jgi:hypothetical protein